jgi:ribosomal protein S18 acetylase RimI-like enzyme
MNNAAVRPAGPQDLPQIVRIEEAAFEPARRSSRRALRRALASEFQRVLVVALAHSEATPLGYLIAWPYRHTWRIYNLATDPAHRNLGLGHALLADVRERARSSGATRLVLEARIEPGLIGFYRRQGFCEARRLADYYASGEDAWRMELALRPV